MSPEVQPYIDAFAAPPGEPEWLARARRRGLDRFAAEGFPSRRGEAWRYLDLAGLVRRPLLPRAAAGRADLRGFDLPETAARLVLVDGRFAPELSELAPGLGPLSAAAPELAEAAFAQPAGPFAALGAALFGDGFALDVAPGAVLDRPVAILHVASSGGASFHTRNIVRLGAGARASLVELFVGEGDYWRNDATALSLGEGAVLDRVAVVEEAAAAVHLNEATATLAASARLGNFALILAGRTVRQEIRVAVAGEDAACRLDGAFVLAGDEEANIVTAVDHLALRGETRELVKGVAAGRAHGAFQGRIVVREGAQKADAHQLSRNLILGRGAAIDTKPELEIYADDVKCAHGASVGDLDEAAMFYLASRGIAPDEARRLLVEAFVGEAVERAEPASLRPYLLRRLGARLTKLEAAR
jgi:Fe-S cluster assembly protein SufD